MTATNWCLKLISAFVMCIVNRIEQLVKVDIDHQHEKLLKLSLANQMM